MANATTAAVEYDVVLQRRGRFGRKHKMGTIRVTVPLRMVGATTLVVDDVAIIDAVADSLVDFVEGIRQTNATRAITEGDPE